MCCRRSIYRYRIPDSHKSHSAGPWLPLKCPDMLPACPNVSVAHCTVPSFRGQRLKSQCSNVDVSIYRKEGGRNVSGDTNSIQRCNNEASKTWVLSGSVVLKTQNVRRKWQFSSTHFNLYFKWTQRNEDVLGEWRYSSTNSWPRQ